MNSDPSYNSMRKVTSNIAFQQNFKLTSLSLLHDKTECITVVLALQGK